MGQALAVQDTYEYSLRFTGNVKFRFNYTEVGVQCSRTHAFPKEKSSLEQQSCCLLLILIGVLCSYVPKGLDKVVWSPKSQIDTVPGTRYTVSHLMLQTDH